MTPKLPLRKVKKNGQTQWMLDLRSLKKGRKFYTNELEAKAVRQRYAREIAEHGVLVTEFTHEDRLEFLWCQKRCRDAGTTLRHVVDSYFVANPGFKEKDIPEAIEEFLAAKQASGKRKRYLEQLRYTISHLDRALIERKCHLVRREHIEGYLGSQPWKMVTKRGKLKALIVFWGWCLKKGYCTLDPTTNIERFHPEHTRPGILAPDQCRKLVETTIEVAPAILPYVVLCLFAGLRPSETMETHWRDIDLDKGFVKVDSIVSKTRQRRIVQLEPNAVEWLKHAKRHGGALPPKNWRKFFDRVRDVSGLTKGWPHDAMRHSYVSYSLPLRGAMRTAENAGHSEAILYQHYRELVTKEEAERFWGIRPE